MTVEAFPAFAKPEIAPSGPRREAFYRHTLTVRLTHWINALALSLLLMSGLQIFNAHPELYWGQKGQDGDLFLLGLHAMNGPHGMRGVTTILGHSFDTTGFLGASSMAGHIVARGWPSWLTVPSWQDLATGRRWHFFFAWVLVLNGLVYWIWTVVSRHLSRDLWPTLGDLRNIPRDVVDHLKNKHPRGEAAKRYNVLQKLAYLSVVLVLIPGMVLTGLTMSPGMDTVLPGLLQLFGGRQSARTIHFCLASLLVLFFIVHIAQVILAGPINEMRSIITGRFAIPPEHEA